MPPTRSALWTTIVGWSIVILFLGALLVMMAGGTPVL